MYQSREEGVDKLYGNNTADLQLSFAVFAIHSMLCKSIFSNNTISSFFNSFDSLLLHMSRDVRKPVFGFSDQV